MTSEPAATRPLVLAADYDPVMLRLIKLLLKGQQLDLITASDGKEALQLFVDRKPDLVLTETVLPNMDGLEMLRKIRETSPVPIIIVSSRDAPIDKVRALELGADDYITKPIDPRELVPKIRAVLRRGSEITIDAVITAGDLEINLSTRTVYRDGKPIKLTRTEWNLLQYLVSNKGKMILNAEILRKVWGPEYVEDFRYLMVWISRLRAKLEINPRKAKIIRTFPGLGYMLIGDKK